MRDLLSPCRLCPRECAVDRAAGRRGPCGVADQPMVSRYSPVYGEERFLSGTRGSGLIWMTGCNMGCVFCQNFDINLEMRGGEVTVERLADIHLELQRWGCHNVNWVTPTHQAPFLVEALENARSRGFRLPIVYNCGGYESLEVLRRLEGCVDIYLPDFKYWDPDRALQRLEVENYPETCRAAVLEMHRQVGDLELDTDGVATRGLAVRHLLMPDGFQDAEDIVRWIASEIGPGTAFNLMHQYRPLWKAEELDGLREPTRLEVWDQALEMCRRAGMTNLVVPRAWGRPALR